VSAKTGPGRSVVETGLGTALISDEGTEAYSAPSKEQEVNCSTEESLQKGATHA
jgi:hypothetical protein